MELNWHTGYYFYKNPGALASDDETIENWKRSTDLETVEAQLYARAWDDAIGYVKQRLRMLGL